MIILQYSMLIRNDQARRFRKLGIKAVAVNKDTFNDGLEKVRAKPLLNANDT